MQSVLGLYWVFINPLVTTAVLTIVFSLLIRVPSEGTPYFLLVLTGLLGWNFFANAVSDATQSLLVYSNLLGKVPFPREVLPSASVAARAVDFAASAVVLLVLVVIFSPQGLGPTALWLPLLLLVQFTLALGAGFFCSMANLFYRDVQQLVQLLLMLGFFLAPVPSLVLAVGTELVEERQRASAVGLVYAANEGASTISPLIGGLVAEVFGLRISFLFYALLFLAATAIAVVLHRVGMRLKETAEEGAE